MRPLLAAAALGVVVGCVVDLDPLRDCGDNYVDHLAGEECEPSLADSLAGYCPAGEIPGPGACNPDTCRFVPGSCTRCGNGVLDPGEACDPEDMNQPTCLFGGVAQCRSDCTIDQSACARGCGDRVVDLDQGEECDPGPVTDLTDKGVPVEIDCRELSSPIKLRAYGSGIVTRCVECKWDRSNCSYCGNELLEDQEVVLKENLQALPEVCDRDYAGTGLERPPVDRTALYEHCRKDTACNGFGDYECAYTCINSCTGFGPPPGGMDPECCTPKGDDCPYQGEDVKEGRWPCCYEKAHPGTLRADQCSFSGPYFVCE